MINQQNEVNLVLTQRELSVTKKTKSSLSIWELKCAEIKKKDAFAPSEYRQTHLGGVGDSKIPHFSSNLAIHSPNLQKIPR